MPRPPPALPGQIRLQVGSSAASGRVNLDIGRLLHRTIREASGAPPPNVWTEQRLAGAPPPWQLPTPPQAPAQPPTVFPAADDVGGDLVAADAAFVQQQRAQLGSLEAGQQRLAALCARQGVALPAALQLAAMFPAADAARVVASLASSKGALEAAAEALLQGPTDGPAPAAAPPVPAAWLQRNGAAPRGHGHARARSAGGGTSAGHGATSASTAGGGAHAAVLLEMFPALSAADVSAALANCNGDLEAAVRHLADFSLATEPAIDATRAQTAGATTLLDTDDVGFDDGEWRAAPQAGGDSGFYNEQWQPARQRTPPRQLPDERYDGNGAGAAAMAYRPPQPVDATDGDALARAAQEADKWWREANAYRAAMVKYYEAAQVWFWGILETCCNARLQIPAESLPTAAGS